jgi:cytochrome bd-type quinol oxidase subunit 2
MLVGVLIGIIALGGMVYLAVDKKSTLTVRLASLAAIAVMLITVVICFIVVLNDNRVPIDPSTLIVGAPPAAPPKKNNSVSIVLLIIFAAAIFTFIAVAAMRENKKNKPK